MAATAPREGLLQRRRRKLPATVFKTWSPEKSESLEECDEMKKYRIMERIGHGSSGQVYHAQRVEDGEQVAMKFMSAMDQDMILMRRDEYKILRDLDHPHIVRALDFFCSARTAVLVLSYHGGGTLQQATQASSGSRLPEEVAQPLARKLLSAVDYLHQHRIVHRDVKADNILVSKDLSQLHLADFNTARSLLEGGSLTMTGTVEYSAPEVLAGESPSEQNDVWGAGLCLHLMLAGHLPRRPMKYASLTDFGEAVRSSPVECRGPGWADVSEDAKDTVKRCLAISKQERPAAMMVLKMPWLSEDEGPKVAPRASTNDLPERLQGKTFERSQSGPADFGGYPLTLPSEVVAARAASSIYLLIPAAQSTRSKRQGRVPPKP